VAYSKVKLKSSGNRASPCFIQFWIGKLSDKCLPITSGGAVNHNNISDYFYFLIFFPVSYPLHASAPLGHPQVEKKQMQQDATLKNKNVYLYGLNYMLHLNTF
jgi:hypothetical protein